MSPRYAARIIAPLLAITLLQFPIRAQNASYFEDPNQWNVHQLEAKVNDAKAASQIAFKNFSESMNHLGESGGEERMRQARAEWDSARLGYRRIAEDFEKRVSEVRNYLETMEASTEADHQNIAEQEEPTSSALPSRMSRTNPCDSHHDSARLSGCMGRTSLLPLLLHPQVSSSIFSGLQPLPGEASVGLTLYAGGAASTDAFGFKMMVFDFDGSGVSAFAPENNAADSAWRVKYVGKGKDVVFGESAPKPQTMVMNNMGNLGQLQAAVLNSNNPQVTSAAGTANAAAALSAASNNAIHLPVSTVVGAVPVLPGMPVVPIVSVPGAGIISGGNSIIVQSNNSNGIAFGGNNNAGTSTGGPKTTATYH